MLTCGPLPKAKYEYWYSNSSNNLPLTCTRQVDQSFEYAHIYSQGNKARIFMTHFSCDITDELAYLWPGIGMTFDQTGVWNTLSALKLRIVFTCLY